MKIAVYAIAKNEEKFASRFAKSCEAADLTLVLDTGCTDQTAAILADHGVEVHSESVTPWRFDAARNRALELVPENFDICVKLDLDEVLSPGWRDKLETGWNPAKTTQAWYTYTWSWKRPNVPQQRFLQNHCHARHGFAWRHRCHEALYLIDGTPSTVVIRDMHVGHHPDHSKSRSGYLPLIEADHQAEPSTRSRFYLGREYFFCQRFVEATALFHEYLELSQYPAERGVACNYLYMMTSDRRWALQAAAESPTRQHHLLAAKASLRDRKFEDAIRWCSEAANTKPALVFSEYAVQDAEIFDVAAESAWQAGERDIAFSYLERASQIEPSKSRNQKYLTWAGATT